MYMHSIMNSLLSQGEAINIVRDNVGKIDISMELQIINVLKLLQTVF